MPTPPADQHRSPAPAPDADPDYAAYVDRVWRGEDDLTAHLSGAFADGGLIPLGERTGLFAAFANVFVFDTGDGLVLVDSGDVRTAEPLHRAVRAFRGPGTPVRSVVFTHGHVDHVFGVGPFDADAERERGFGRPSSPTRRSPAGSPGTRRPPGTTPVSTSGSSASPPCGGRRRTGTRTSSTATGTRSARAT